MSSGRAGDSVVILRTPFLRACRIALNYMPIWFGSFFTLCFLMIALGLRPIAVVTAGLWVACYFVLAAWIRRCAVLRVRDGSLIVVNPFRRVNLRPDDVVKVKEHVFRLGKDRCPLLVTRSDERVPLVAATGEPMDLLRWREIACR
ncbi:MAG: hypothetical protein LC792_22625 [Actinobacteria bacterium]|nr:hypothetical protein [Actinomycetota bacterium]